MPKNRKEQQAEILIKLGYLLAPLQDIVDYPDQQTPQTRARASAKFANDQVKFSLDVDSFCKGEEGHRYRIEDDRAMRWLSKLADNLMDYRDEPEKLAPCLEQARNGVVDAILAIPTEVDFEVLEAQSPFQAYCKLKTFFETVSRKVIWADPYMGASLFHRFLRQLPASVSVTLITKDRGNHGEYQSFLDVSKLYAQEKGASRYTLIVESTNHDRWLQCDKQIYHLGGSAKDAGKRSPFTISKLAPSQVNFQKLQDLIDSGTELFGPNQTTHQ